MSNNSSFSVDIEGNAVCEPFKTLPNVWSWSPGSSSQEAKLSTEFTLKERPIKSPPALPIAIEGNTSNRKPNTESQILVCHDMMGGYLKDKYIYGIKEAPSYRFYHWHLIDTFIYFSHEFVTIPPLGWIKAAHKEGVTVLGTIITEWEDGAKRCEEFLNSTSSADIFASKLAEIAEFYGFDGWLINIENKIESNKVEMLQRFVEQLTIKCHQKLPHAKVLWYDSVIQTGELIWQDELNHNNKMFFDVCDGIFLNYLMTKEKLERSRNVAGQDGRQFDVYAGIDVFGRGSPSGGGFNCKQDLAMILDQGLSCALFATGWVYQHEENRKEEFDTNEIKFWGMMNNLLQIKPVSAPFTSSFCHGYGDRFFVKGQIVDDYPWQDLSLQQIQPSFTPAQFLSDTNTIEDITKKVEMGVDVTDAYQGGSCLKLSILPENDTESVLFRLFKVHPNKEAKTDLRISVTWKCSIHAEVPFVFVVFVHGRDDPFHRVMVYMDQDLTEQQQKYICQQVQANCGTEHSKAEFNICLTKTVTNGWKVSSLGLEKSLLELDNGEVTTEITTAFLMLPSFIQVAVPKKLQAIQLGFIEISHEDNTKKLDACNQIRKAAFIEAKVNGSICQRKLSKIFTHPTLENVFKDEADVEIIDNSLERVSMKDAATSPHVIVRQCLDLTETQSETTETYTLCFLQWEILSEPVDYFLIYGLDADKKTLIGHSVLNTFVWKNSDNKKYLDFSIQPIFTDARYLHIDDQILLQVQG